jgi:release factor glutamine methyltransferase
MEINSLIKKATKNLKNHSPSPDLDVEILLSWTLNETREFILSNPEKEVSREKLKIFQKLLEKRKRQMPIAYLTGSKNFYGRSFFVSPDCLIPRPETELLVEKTLEYCHKEIYPSKKTFVWDLGTGSGCILITLGKELLKNPRFSAFQFLGIDVSGKALKIAQKNSKTIFPEAKIDFLKADLLDFVDKSYLKDLKNAQLVLTANLPYLSKELYKNCPKSVLDFEPQKALLAKKQGLGLYFKLLEQIKIKKIDQLVWSLYLIFEISPEQKILMEKKLKEIFPETQCKFSKDLAGKWRFVEILL